VYFKLTYAAKPAICFADPQFLWHGSLILAADANNSFGMHTYENSPATPFRMNTYKMFALELVWNEHLQKNGGGVVGASRTDASLF
jgi:hypothetical protein